MADSKPVGSFTLLKTELKRIFDEGLLLSSYNIYSQFMPKEMEAFILELVALEIAYHAGGLSKYGLTKKWTELIWDVVELKRIMTEDKLHNNPMCRKFLLALEKQDDIAPRTGVRQSFASTGPHLGIVTMITVLNGGRLTCTCSREPLNTCSLISSARTAKTPKKERRAMPL
jgi:hypothetical protein